MIKPFISHEYAAKRRNSPASLAGWYAEAVRTLLWANTVGAEGMPMTYSTLRLLRELREHAPTNSFAEMINDCADDWLDAENHPQRALLDDLAAMGDLVHIGKGQWRPCPLRCVQIDIDLPDRVLIGTMPIRMMPSSWQARIEMQGLRRLLRHGPPSDEGKGEWWWPATLDEWLGPPPISLEDLATLLTQIKLKPCHSNQPDRYEVYIPSSHTWQHYRWQRVHSNLQGCYLVRCQENYGYRSYSMAEIRRGNILSLSEDLPAGHRRIMYALDAQAGNPVDAHERAGGDIITFSLYNELPAYEQRLTTAFGWRTTVRPNSPYPFCLHVSHKHASLVRKALRELGMRLIPQDGN